MMTHNETLLGIQEIIAIKNQFIFLTLKPPAVGPSDMQAGTINMNSAGVYSKAPCSTASVESQISPSTPPIFHYLLPKKTT